MQKHLSQVIKSYKKTVKTNLAHQKDNLIVEFEAKIGNEAINEFLRRFKIILQLLLILLIDFIKYKQPNINIKNQISLTI